MPNIQTVYLPDLIKEEGASDAEVRHDQSGWVVTFIYEGFTRVVSLGRYVQLKTQK